AEDGIRDRNVTGVQTCALPISLQNALGIPTESISGGALLMYGGKALPPGRPGVLVSVARSGDSPESSGAVELLLSTEPQIRHIVVTCNEHGRLARAWHETKNVRVIKIGRAHV